MKKFVINFILSLIAYFVINFTSFFVVAMFYPGDEFILYWRFFGFNMITAAIIFHMIIVAALYFFLGTKLSLLGKHWKNYLSVCGSFIVGCLVLPTPWVMILNSSFMWLFFLGGGNVWFYTITPIIASLPSIITWLGMLYKSRKD